MRWRFDTVPRLSFANYNRVVVACGLAWGLIVQMAARAIAPSHDLWFLACVGGVAALSLFASRATLRVWGIPFVSRAEGAARVERERYHLGVFSLCAYSSIWFVAVIVGMSAVVRRLAPDWPHLWSSPVTFVMFVSMLVTTIWRHRAGQRAAPRASQLRVEPWIRNG